MRRLIFWLLLLAVVSLRAQTDWESRTVMGVQPGDAPVDFSYKQLSNGMHVALVKDTESDKNFIYYQRYPVTNALGQQRAVPWVLNFLISERNTSFGLSTGISCDVNVHTGILLIPVWEDFGDAMTRVTQMMHATDWTEEELAKAKAQAREIITGAELNNARRLRNRLAPFFRFGDNHPYGERVTLRDIDRVTLTDIIEYQQNFAGPEHGILTLVGPDEQLFRRVIDEAFVPLTRGNNHFLHYFPGASANHATGVYLVQIDEADAVYFEFGYALVLRYQQLSFPAYLLLAAGLEAHLQQQFPQVRDLEVAYVPDRHMGHFKVRGAADETVATESMAAIQSALRAFADQPISEAQLQTWQDRVVEEQSSNWYQRSVNRTLLELLYNRLPDPFYTSLLDSIRSTNRTAIQQLAETELAQRELTLLVVARPQLAEQLVPLATNGQVRKYNAAGEQTKLSGAVLPVDLSAAQIITNYIEAIGGEEALLEVSDYERRTTTVLPHDTLRRLELKKGGDRMLSEIYTDSTLAVGHLLNGPAGQLYLNKALRLMMPEEHERAILEAAIFPELGYLSAPYELRLEGEGRLGNQQVYRIVVVHPAKTMVLYFDTRTGLKVGTEETLAIGEKLIIKLDNYQEVDGVLFPFQETSYIGNNTPTTTRVDVIRLNSGLDDSRFRLIPPTDDGR